MMDFWDRAWAIHAMAVRDYFKERDAQQKKWDDFCQKCTSEILTEASNIAGYIQEVTAKQTGQHVHRDLAQGIIYLPLYGFYLVLQRQNGIAKEQSRLLQLYFQHFNLPFTMNLFLDATKRDNYARKNLLELVGISQTYAGGFWVQFFKTLYRTDEDETYVKKVIDSFCSITMRFAAMNGQMPDALLSILENFFKDVQVQSVLCRQVPDDEVDFYGDSPFVEHFNKFKEEAYKVCRHTMDEDDEDLNPTNVFQGVTLGGIYQVVSRSSRNRADKIRMTDDILSQIDTGSSVDGAYIFKYMEDLHGEETSMLAAMMHMFTDVEKPMGWIILTRAGGTYNLDTKKKVQTLQEGFNFLIGMENYLSDKYPMSGFGTIASDYAKKVMEIVGNDIDENVTIVDEETGVSTPPRGSRPATTSSQPVSSTPAPEKKKGFFQKLFGG